jgi:cell pole-organizing protein PopZ
MSMTNKPVEPSMEEILASIRKIIAEEPIGTRPDPVNPALKASPRSDASQKLSPLPEALAIDDVLDMAGGAGSSPGASARNGAASKSTDAGWNLGKPVGATVSTATPQTSHATEAKAAGNGAAHSEEVKPAVAQRSDTFGTTVPGRAAERETAVERPAAPRVDVALSEAQKKVERHLGSLPDVAERPAPLGLRSVREPNRDAKPAAGSLMGRVAAAHVPTESVADIQTKAHTANGAAGASAVAASATAKQAEATAAAKTESVATGATAAKAAAAAAAPATAAKTEPAKPAAGSAKTSLEEAVAEMLRPMLSTWLDTNLPRIVQEVVREEMAKKEKSAS